MQPSPLTQAILTLSEIVAKLQFVIAELRRLEKAQGKPSGDN